MPTELTPLTDAELDAIDAAALKATPGRYEHYHRGHPSMGWDFEVADESKKDGIRSGSRGMLEREEDAAYFASLDPQTVRRLVAQARRSSEIDRLTAENARLRAAQEWRPISEAPKDRTEIIGARIKHGKVWAIAQIQFNGLAWYESHSGDGFNTPTHWMPLTAPPTEAEKGIGGK